MGAADIGAGVVAKEATEDGGVLRMLLQVQEIIGMAAYRAAVLSPLSGAARDKQAAALPTPEALILRLGLAAETLEIDAPRKLIDVVRELEVAVALPEVSDDAMDGAAGGSQGELEDELEPVEQQLGALSDPVAASELIAPLAPSAAALSQVERVLDEVTGARTLWAANTSAAAAAATVVPLLTFTGTSPEEVYKTLGAFAAVLLALLALITLAQALAAALGMALRPLARPRAQLGLLKSSVGIACQVGATAIVSLDAVAMAAGGMLIVLAAGVCWLGARIVRRALGIGPERPACARFLAVPHGNARGSRGAPNLTERLLGRASLARGVWEDADSAGTGDEFVRGHGNIFESLVGLPVDKEAQRAMPWAVASVRLPCLGRVHSWKLRASAGVLLTAITALRGAIAGAGAACGGEAGVCSTAVLGGVGLGTVAQVCKCELTRAPSIQI